MEYCPNYAVVISAYSADMTTRYVLRTRCKQWSCDYCAPLNKKTWRWRIMSTIEKLGDNVDWYLWTMTLSPKYHKTPSTKDTLIAWRTHWNKIMGRLRYEFGKFMYIRVLERHKSGVLHVHMLANVTYDDCVRIVEPNADGTENIRHHSDTFEDVMLSYGLGKIHDIKPIVTKDVSNNGHARNVSAYVTKYMTKDVQSEMRNELRGMGISRVRVIQTSHGWQKETRQSRLDWRVGRILYSDWWSDVNNGIETIDLQTGDTVEYALFGGDGEHMVYPSPIE